MIRGRWSIAAAMISARSALRGLVLSTTTDCAADSASRRSCACRRDGLLLLRKLSLLTWACVRSNRSRKNEVFPEAWSPMKMTSCGCIQEPMIIDPRLRPIDELPEVLDGPLRAPVLADAVSVVRPQQHLTLAVAEHHP